MKRFLLSVFAVGMMLFANAQVPGTFSYQGILVDGTGNPVADGNHSVEFDFYSLSAGGTLLYDGVLNNVTTYKGMFTFVIGTGGAGNPVIPTNIWDSQVYLQMSADGTILLPRIQLTSNPYAFKAQTANTIVDNAITSAKIVDGTIVAADLGTGSVNTAKILDGEIVNADISASAAIVDTKLATISTAGKVSGSAISGAMSGTLSAANITGQVGVANGGTGASTLTGALIGNGTSAISAVSGTASQYFRRNAGNTAYEFATLLASDIPSLDAGKITTGSLPLTRGGTGATDATTARTNLGLTIGTDVQAPVSASNGLTLASNVVTLGGTLTGATTLSSGGFNFLFGGPGKMGVGSTNPQSKFAVGGNVTIGNTYADVNAAPTNGLLVQGITGIGTTTPLSQLDVEGNLAVGTSYSGNIAAPTNGAIIEGNVGIGTNAPALKLDVNGSSIFRGYTGINRTTSLGGSTLFDVDGTAAANAYLGMYINGSNAGSWPFYGYATGGIARSWTMYDGTLNLWKLVIGGTDRLIVNNSGNMGIGATPVSKLDVEGGAVIGSTYSGTNAAPTNGLLVEGNVGLGTTVATYPVTLYNSTDARVVNIEQDYTGASTQYGMTLDMTSATGTSTKYGIDCNVSGTAGSANSVYGLETDIILNGSGTAFGVNSSISSAGTGTGSRYGVYSVASSGSTAANGGTICGVYGYGISNSANSSGPVYGIYGSTFDGGGTGTHYAGYFAGDVAYTGTITDVSDRRLKKNIQAMPSMLSKLMQLKPSTFNYRSDEFKFMSLPSEKQLGLIAQEVEPLFPEAVTDNTHPGEMDEEGKSVGVPFDYKGVDYTVMIPVLIKGMQEQQVQIEELKSTVDDLKSQLSQYKDLSAQVVELKKLMTDKETAVKSTMSGSIKK